MNNYDKDEIMKPIEEDDRKMYEENMSKLKEILDKIETGEKTARNYYKASVLYAILNENNKFKPEIQNCKELAKQIAFQDIEKNNNAADAYCILSEICQSEKNKEEMLRYIDKAIELNPTEYKYYTIRGEYYVEIGKEDLADKDYDKACELNPGMAESIKVLKRVRAEIKDFEEDEQKMYEENMSELKEIWDKIEGGETTIQNYEDAFHLLDLMGISKNNKYKQEIENYVHLTEKPALNDIEKNINPAAAYYVLSRISLYKKDKEEMMRYINKAIELNPTESDYYMIRGDYYVEIGKEDLADKDYDKAIELKLEMANAINIPRDSESVDIINVVLPIVLIICFVIGYIFVKMKM